jgi:Acyl-CoA dehydrogenase, C-terminal domain
VAPESDGALDAESLELLEGALRKTMLSASGPELDAALTELGWAEMLSDMPDLAVPLVFRLLGETGSHASVLVDVVLHATGNEIGGSVELPLPYAGNTWVVWERGGASEATGKGPGASEATATLGGLPLRREDEGYPIRVAEARLAAGWWLVGSARAMLALARQHALDRVQFGRPIAGFQAIRHRLAETLVAIEGAEATLSLPGADNPDLTALLAKAAAGKAALTAAKHCQQVLGGIGFTAEHDLHLHVKRALVLDGLLGSSRELTRRAGAGLRARGSAPRLAHL